MKAFNIKGYTITYPKDMLITINEEKNMIVAIDRERERINCILEFDEDSFVIGNIWNIKYIIKDKNICLTYSFTGD